MKVKNYGTVIGNEPIVSTTHGKVLGINRDGVAVFLGIPYGGDVSGSNRFQRAKQATDWLGVKDCTKIGKLAMQPQSFNPTFMKFQNYFTGGRPNICGATEEAVDENCLVINVLTPGLDHKRRPVLVHIHGGGYDEGSGTVAIGGDNLCREEDILLVSLNHRLNLFGAMYLGAFDSKYADSGMVGMLDVVLALEWVRDNIEEFGGDPSKVTIMGESGGAMKVNNLLAMKCAKNLFRGAIVESGSTPIASVSTEQATEITERFLKKIGIASDNLDKLFQMPADVLIETYKASRMENIRFWPIGDDINIPYNKYNDFYAPEISKTIPLIVGASEDEMSSFIFATKSEITWSNLRDALLGKVDGIFGLFGGTGGIDEENVDCIIATFKENDPKNNSAEHLFMKIKSLSGTLAGGAYYQALAKAEQKAAPVYHYMIRHDFPFPADENKRYAWHTADLPLQFRSVYLSETERISKDMASLWAAFVRDGKPSTSKIDWKAFDLESRNVMIFDDECKMERDPYKKLFDVLPTLNTVL